MSCEGSGRNRHVRKASTTLAASCCLRPTFVAARTNTATARTLLLINCIARDTNQPMKAMIGQGWRHRSSSRPRSTARGQVAKPAPVLRVPMAHSARARSATRSNVGIFLHVGFLRGQRLRRIKTSTAAMTCRHADTLPLAGDRTWHHRFH